MSLDDLKKAAALAAIAHISSGMKLGLGTGSTAKHFVDAVGEKVKEGWDLVCVPTSEATRKQAEGLGIRLTTLDETPVLDVTVDGADELDSDLRLIKGGGGALLREKIVASSSRKMIVIADDSKKVATLGKFPLPVEVVPFGLKATGVKIEQAFAWSGNKGPITLRMRDGKPYVTDNGNVILDCALGRIENVEKLAAALSSIPGVVDHGLFIGMASLALIATAHGIQELRRQAS
ncbi:ribose-5-phosphate isomerase RpiA [Taklimakanibacter lacteus]|uniref:ribose-5-phosphate isomerase RpiA n=1 Tax=Taklimakanibacter lacteus TaxID=2268456 RepID=UPI000E662896